VTALQNFDLGPSLVDEVMRTFGSSVKQAEQLERSPVVNRSIEEKSSVPTTPCQSEELKTSVDSTVVHTFDTADDSAHKETFVSANCDGLPDVQTSTAENVEKYCPQNAAESSKYNQMLKALSASPLRISTNLEDAKFNKDVERKAASLDIWHQQQQIPQTKSKQLSANVHRKTSADAACSTAGSRYPAVIGNCSLSPRSVYPRESAVRGLSATKRSPSSSLSSSSEERIPAGMSSRVAASLVAASSSSLPARSSLVQDSWPKLPHPSGTKVSSGDSIDSESSNLLQRLKGKASLSRLSGFRLSIDSRTAKSGLPTQNLNVNEHFFNRLREQESQNSDRSEDETAKLAEPLTDDRHLRLGASRSHPVSGSRISEHREVDNSGVETVSSGTDGTSSTFSSHDEVARLSCRSTESHDSFSHDSEHSSTTTQPSDEGVYSDDSVAASVDELRPRSDQRTPTSRRTTSAATAVTLGICNKRDVFWTCPVDFRDFVNFEENSSRGDQSESAERYSLRTDMCYEDRMECELNGYVDMDRYFVLIFTELQFI